MNKRTLKKMTFDANSRVSPCLELDEPDRKHFVGGRVAATKWVLSGVRENDLSVSVGGSMQCRSKKR